MGDISMRGKGKALKMKKGGALPSNKGASKAGMQSKQGRNFLLPKEEKPKRFKKPGKPEPRPRPMPKPRPDKRPRPMPMPMPKPRPDRSPRPRPMPMPKPRPDRSPQIKEKIKQLMEELKPRRRQTGLPVKRKDGGEMITGKFGKAASEFLTQAMTKGGLGAMGVSAEKLKKAFEQAKKMKPTGRINTDDLKRAIDSMKKAKKIDMSPGRRKAMTGSETGKTRVEKLAQSIKDRPLRQKLRRKTRRMI